MKVYGQLERAQIEVLGADPTGADLVVGRLWYRSDTKKYKVYDGTLTQEFVDLDSAQALSSKTLASPTITGSASVAQITTPANPAAGYTKIYPKADNKLYSLNSAGTEKEVVDTNSGQTLSNKIHADPEMTGSLLAEELASTPSTPAAGKSKLYFKNDGNLYRKSSGGVETQFASASAGLDSINDFQNWGLSVTASAGSLILALKTKAGTDPSPSDPVKVGFPVFSGLLATGYSLRTITSALGLTLTPGQHLGHFLTTVSGFSGMGRKVYVYLVSDGTTVYLGASGTRWQEGMPLFLNSASATSSTQIWVGSLPAGTWACRQVAELGFGTSNVSASWVAPNQFKLGNVFTPNYIRIIGGGTTGTGNNVWNALTNNSIIMPPGIYRGFGRCSFNRTAACGYTRLAHGWATNNGNNTTTTPSQPTTSALLPTSHVFYADLPGAGVDFQEHAALETVFRNPNDVTRYLVMMGAAATPTNMAFQPFPCAMELDSHGQEPAGGF